MSQLTGPHITIPNLSHGQPEHPGAIAVVDGNAGVEQPHWLPS